MLTAFAVVKYGCYMGWFPPTPLPGNNLKMCLASAEGSKQQCLKSKENNPPISSMEIY
jgi:hypothetical protein